MSPNIGGIESFIMNIYRNIDRSKIQFDFLCFSPKIPFSEEITKLGGKIYYLKSRRENYFRNKKQVYSFFKEHQEYKLVHFHLNTCSYIDPILAASKTNKKIIVHSHNQWMGKNLRIRLLHFLNKNKIATMADELLACSNLAGNYMFNSKKYKLIKNAIDAEKFRYNPIVREKVRTILNIKDKFVIGHVGRFSYQKNHDFLLDIFDYVYKKNRNSILILIGSGELEEEIKNKIKRLNLEDVVLLLGNRNDIHNILQAMDVFVFPSYYEGLPISVIEAQAAGLPCIISNNITKDVSITKNMIFISLNESAEIWAQYALAYSKNYQRKDTISDIINSGYDIKSLVKRIEKIYTDLYYEI